MSQKYEYATMEWLWDSGAIRVNLPGTEKSGKGMYPEIVNMLGQLGSEGWDVCACVSGGNWLFWTLKRSK